MATLEELDAAGQVVRLPCGTAVAGLAAIRAVARRGSAPAGPAPQSVLGVFCARPRASESAAAAGGLTSACRPRGRMMRSMPRFWRWTWRAFRPKPGSSSKKPRCAGPGRRGTQASVAGAWPAGAAPALLDLLDRRFGLLCPSGARGRGRGRTRGGAGGVRDANVAPPEPLCFACPRLRPRPVDGRARR